MKRFLLSLSSSILLVNSQCNRTRYEKWYNRRFFSELDNTESTILVKEQKGFWGVSRILQYPDTPSFGQVMEKAADICRRSLQTLKRDLAGRHGDVENYAIWGPMCSVECLDSDILHLEAMEESECNCLELSPQPSDEHYRVEGEFCRKNSGRLMCEVLDRCGVWTCRLGDFMCPRHEYNKEWTRFRGFGDCSGSWAVNNSLLVFIILISSSVCVLVQYG